MIQTTIYLLISIGFYFIAIWWLFNHFDTMINMQMKMHDEIIEKVLQIETRVECLEEGEDASDKVSNAQIEQATLDSYIVGE
tara:strand:- start:136 stop:381 length:246 start_codon:yes stop_codon:yes gene_type:complete